MSGTNKINIGVFTPYNAHHHCRLPPADIVVPNYELPLPEGVGEEKIQQEHMSLREIEETWKERLHGLTPPRTLPRHEH